MPRALWKGAITFGLVHVPVALYPASREEEVSFDWLDQRSMDPVGYKRINKRTGKDVPKEQIVKGVQQEDGKYVILSEAEIKAAYPKTTQTIDIQAFVKAEEISFVYLEKPYYLEPVGKAGKVYALLREALDKAGVIGIARMVIHSKEHLAALLPAGPALMLGTLRWATEIRPADELQLPPAGASANHLKDAELDMALQLIEQQTVAWDPRDFRDEFSDAIRALVSKKAKAGKTKTVQPLEDAATGASDNVVDLTELLRGSLKRGKVSGGTRKAG